MPSLLPRRSLGYAPGERGGLSSVEWYLLRSLKEADLEQVLARGRARKFATREVIWHEGDRAETVHLIRSGRIGIRLLTPLGEVATVAVLGSGQAAGLIAVHTTGRFHSSTAIALEPTESVAIWVDDLTTIRRKLAAVDDALIHSLADRVIDLTNQLVDALYAPADTRVLHRLVALSKRSEEHTSELQSRGHLVCRLLLEKKKKNKKPNQFIKHNNDSILDHIA